MLSASPGRRTDRHAGAASMMPRAAPAVGEVAPDGEGDLLILQLLHGDLRSCVSGWAAQRGGRGVGKVVSAPRVNNGISSPGWWWLSVLLHL